MKLDSNNLMLLFFLLNFLSFHINQTKIIVKLAKTSYWKAKDIFHGLPLALVIE